MTFQKPQSCYHFYCLLMIQMYSMSHKNPKTLCEIVNLELCRVSNWLTANHETVFEREEQKDGQ